MTEAVIRAKGKQTLLQIIYIVQKESDSLFSTMNTITLFDHLITWANEEHL